MSDETRRVLDLLAQGKVSVDEADQLLRALATPTQPSAGTATISAGEKPTPRYVRIAVHKAANDHRRDRDMNIRVPIAVVKSGMRIGALIPGLAGDQIAAQLRAKGFDIDFSKLDAAAIESVLKELGDTNIDIDSGKAQVRITCE